MEADRPDKGETSAAREEGISYIIMIAINLITLYSGTLLLIGMSQHNYFMYTIISSALRDYIAGASQKKSASCGQGKKPDLGLKRKQVCKFKCGVCGPHYFVLHCMFAPHKSECCCFYMPTVSSN